MTKLESDYVKEWRKLSGAAKDTLRCLCEMGPTYDGDVPSKAGRDELLAAGLISKVVVRGNSQGYQAANYFGSKVYRFGFVEPRKGIVRALVGDPSQVSPTATWRSPKCKV